MAWTDQVEEGHVAKGKAKVADVGGKQRLWARRIDAWRRSGESQAAYCRRHGLKRALFVYWKRRLEEMGAATKGSSAIQFVEVPAVHGCNCSVAATGIVLVAAGCRVELEADFDEAALRRVLTVLEAGR